MLKIFVCDNRFGKDCSFIVPSTWVTLLLSLKSLPELDTRSKPLFLRSKKVYDAVSFMGYRRFLNLLQDPKTALHHQNTQFTKNTG